MPQSRNLEASKERDEEHIRKEITETQTKNHCNRRSALDSLEENNWVCVRGGFKTSFNCAKSHHYLCQVLLSVKNKNNIMSVKEIKII